MGFLLPFIMAAQLRFVTCGTVQQAMVFEAFSDGDDTSYDLYMGNEVSTQRHGSKVHFKDPLVNMWGNQISVHEVTLAIANNSVEEAFVVFNGTGTDKTSWMAQDRVLDSSYTDIRAKSTNYFSVDGLVLPDGKGRRAFYMNEGFYGCDRDVGWIQLLAGTGYCPWETTSVSKTLVFFIPQNEAGVWKNNIQTADSMRIYIKYEEIPGSSTTSTSSSSSGRVSTKVLSITNADVSSEKTRAVANRLVKDETIPGLSTTSTSSLFSGRVTTEVLSTTNIDVSTEKTAAAATTLNKDEEIPGSSTTSTSSSSSGRVSTEVLSTTNVDVSTEKTAAAATTLIKDEEIPESSTTSTSSSSSARVSTEVLSTTNVDVSSEKTAAAAATLVKGTTFSSCVPCGGFQSQNMTLNELKQEVEHLKSQLRVDKTKLSSSIRRRTSAKDKRPSATAVGGVIGGVVMAALLAPL